MSAELVQMDAGVDIVDVLATADPPGCRAHWRRIERLVVSGEDVAVWIRFGGMVEANGRSFDVEGCTIFAVDDDGRIGSITEYLDPAPIYEAFGSG